MRQNTVETHTNIRCFRRINAIGFFQNIVDKLITLDGFALLHFFQFAFGFLNCTAVNFFKRMHIGLRKPDFIEIFVGMLRFQLRKIIVVNAF